MPLLRFGGRKRKPATASWLTLGQGIKNPGSPAIRIHCKPPRTLSSAGRSGSSPSSKVVRDPGFFSFALPVAAFWAAVRSSPWSAQKHTLPSLEVAGNRYTSDHSGRNNHSFLFLGIKSLRWVDSRPRIQSHSTRNLTLQQFGSPSQNPGQFCQKSGRP